MTVDELIDRFAEIAIAQDKALFDDKIHEFNSLFKKMDYVDNELRKRGADARLKLLRLYEHPNMQVRLKAAKRTLGVAPKAARDVIEMIAVSGWFPQAGEAGMTLFNLDNGTFKPN